MSDHQVKVLFVEDDPHASELLEKLLRLKYPTVEFHIASNGDEGISAFREHQPDVVVTDINMPGTNGIEMTRVIRRDDPEALVIAVSAYHDAELIAEATEAGCCDYLTKPVVYRKLLQSIDTCIDRSLNRKRSA